MLIAGTAAEVAGERFPYVVIGRISIFFYPWFEGHQKAGGAVAALQGMRLVKGGLQRVEIVWGSQRFNRFQRLVIGLNRQDQTGSYRLPIHQYGTSPAHPMGTANVGAGQADLMPDKVGQ